MVIIRSEGTALRTHLDWVLGHNIVTRGRGTGARASHMRSLWTAVRAISELGVGARGGCARVAGCGGLVLVLVETLICWVRGWNIVCWRTLRWRVAVAALALVFMHLSHLALCLAVGAIWVDACIGVGADVGCGWGDGLGKLIGLVFPVAADEVPD